MEPLPIDPYLIRPIFQWTITLICLTLGVRYTTSPDNRNLLKRYSPIGAALLSVAIMIWMGMRVSWGRVFGDSYIYRGFYESMSSYEISEIDFSDEWFFRIIGIWCRLLGFNYVSYFLVIEIGYIGFMFIAFKKLLWENVWFAMLFAFSAFSFFSYGVNGLRNGLACSMVLLAMAFMANGKVKNLPIGIGLCVLALGVHRSTILPITMFFVSLYLIRNIKWAIFFWIASIGVSLVAGGAAQAFFAGLGFDDRISYLSKDMAEGSFSHTGFRWDFLLYSSMPVIFAWYAVMKRNIEDKVFHVLACTYILSNAFWVMVCRANFSNRFAYLSWFMYPLVIAYAAIRLPIWEDQDRKAGQILLAHAGFTIFMWLREQLLNAS